MKANHEPEKGQRNLHAMYSSLGTECVQVNSVTIEPEAKKEQEIEMRHKKIGSRWGNRYSSHSQHNP